jgi:hypothetical protein
VKTRVGAVFAGLRALDAGINAVLIADLTHGRILRLWRLLEERLRG